MSDELPEEGEVIDEMEEAHPGASSRSLLGGLVTGLLVGICLVLFIARNPLQLSFVETMAAWLRGSAAPASADAGGGQAQLWTCGMHPNVIQEGPGSCPICHMDLTPMSMEGLSGGDEPEDEVRGETYTCSMHAMIERDEAGECPICGMDLLLKSELEAQSRPQSQPASGVQVRSERELLFYRNPMDPMVTSPVPMKDHMGMDYVAVYSDEVEGAGEEGATVTIVPGTIQNMNVVTATVVRGDLTRQIRTVGYLDYDDERMVSVTTKYRGFVEKVHANYLGQEVRKGDPLFDVYSPELVQTQEELLSAISFAHSLRDASLEARERAELLVTAARRRLSYWDVSPAQVADIETAGAPLRRLTVRSTASGLVMKRMAGLQGMAITPGMEVLHVADLSVLWLRVEIYEDQLSWMREGNMAHVSFSYFPGESFTGQVRYIEPRVQEKTRTVGVRLAIPNPEGRLRAGMYAAVSFAPVAREDVVLVPTEAILRTGERDVVVVALGEGRFAPRELLLGLSGGGQVEVLSGLEAGEDIVTSSQFLIDSESSLREVILKMIAGKKGN